MELLYTLEKTIVGWLKNVPHLPEVARKWLGENVWWIALVGAILSGIGLIIALTAVLGAIALLGSVGLTYYAAATVTAFTVVSGFIGLAFGIVQIVLLAMSIKPLQLKQKQGWTLLFITWLVGALGVVVSAALSLNPLNFITSILFGAIFVAISGYFLFEIRGQFARVEKSRGAKAETSKK